jgi:phenylalanyl-tRNA synthetase beta chain
VSHGMLCSAAELELGTDADGIMELVTDAEPGTPLLDVMPLVDTQLDLEITANRPDLLCHKGVARELGAVLDLPVKLPPVPGAPSEGDTPRRVEREGTVDGVRVAVEDTEGCPRYMAAVIRGIRVGPSPAWLEARLRAIGQRPINNVVDATNYVLFELNQPMHAFDVSKLRGDAIVVRRVGDGERFATLDGEARELSAEMTMICDGEGPTAVGGVMGGLDSEVTEATQDILLECAAFEPIRLRRTRQALRLSTEASYRFERGTDVEGMADALRRAVQLIRAVAGGEEPEAALDVHPKPRKPRTVFLRPSRVQHLLGTPVSKDAIETCLVRLGFPVAPKDDRLHVQVPGWRPDVTREVDLIEEIARYTGYDTFPVELQPLRPSCVPDDALEERRGRLRRALTALGLLEARSLSLGPAGGPDAWLVRNPLSSEEAYLRQDVVSGLVRSVERNWAARQRDIRLFEVAVVFQPSGDPLPREELRVAGVITGARRPPHWSDGGKTPDFDVWDLRALFEAAAREAVPGDVVAVEDGWELRDADGKRRGWARVLEADRPAWAAPLFGFELEMVERETPAVTFRSLPSTPPVERDLALVLPAAVSSASVEEVIAAEAGEHLIGTHIFDEYRGSGVEGRSVAWRLVFRAPERTLRDAEVDEAVARVVDALKEQLGVEQRGT